ncbi:site-specific integrase [Pseudohalocynthiibacter sp. F2068]|jgi:integrase/recombinase XerC|uniref:site-specific integrase n=1 Tax=Pseudohalocynthiibacter sp. F2068 TaxID=2926418 RepID=UPI001FF37E6E|nr:site-specific integrase [Pseudohalocynthiibacter sp. F2068]MCK0104370.1 site-specific integrase [Pseudohalocynthiibacter sp. F2068]
MRKYDEGNERIKRNYTRYLRNAKGQDDKSVDKALAAIVRFEESTKYKSFRNFHIDQAIRFKDFLAKPNASTKGKALGISTIDATLRLVKAFFFWLADKPGYKKAVGHTDTDYFNNTLKARRVAHTARDIPYPSMRQALHAFRAMPNSTEFEKRDRALFAFFLLTCARDGAVASLKLKHINLAEGHVFQDGRDVNTKFSKTIDTYFYPVDPEIRRCLEEWVIYLKEVKLFGPEDALFPKPLREIAPGGGFVFNTLSRDGYAGAAKLNAIIRNAFAMVQMPEYTPHSFRKTLTLHGDQVCTTMEEMKAWSLNMGHDNLATTVNSYLPVTRQRQAEILQGMSE